jgi:hypothetical protein
VQAPTTNRIKLPTGVKVDEEDIPKLLGYSASWFTRKRGDVTCIKVTNKKAKHIKLHRVVMDAPASLEVDHINGDKLDNRKSNLRLCTHAENGRNLKVKTTNKTGVAGVSWDKARNKWAARIKLNYKGIYLGRFDRFDDAVKARKSAENKYFGGFARNANV